PFDFPLQSCPIKTRKKREGGREGGEQQFPLINEESRFPRLPDEWHMLRVHELEEQAAVAGVGLDEVEDAGASVGEGLAVTQLRLDLPVPEQGGQEGHPLDLREALAGTVSCAL